MYFLTQVCWEVRDPIIRALQGNEGRLYPCMEIDLNRPLWHLDLQFKSDVGGPYWRRFVFASIEVLATTLETHSGRCRIHFQTARNDHGGYEISEVRTLLEGLDSHGRRVHIIVLPHQRLVWPNKDTAESSLSDIRILREFG